jgi:hypothetical protein
MKARCFTRLFAQSPTLILVCVFNIIIISAVRSRPRADSSPPPTPPPPREYPCDMNVSYSPSSTRRDVMLFYASHYRPGLLLTISSLISTGTNCRIVLFTATGFNPPDRFNTIVRSFNVEVLPHSDTGDTRALFGHMLRYEFEAKWITTHLEEIDRIMHSDCYDVFFQGDPFHTFSPYDHIRLVKEDQLISQCDWNSNWLKQCYNNDTWYHIRDYNIICTGIITGNATQYLRLIKFMMKRPEWRRCWGSSKDQPIFNNLHWTGIFEAHDFVFSYTDCFHGLFTMHWCQREKPIRFTPENLVLTPMGDVPFLLHQYNRYQEMIDHLTRQCHMETFAQA